jgi:hypothetical protein
MAKRKYTNGKTKLMTTPSKYQAGFLDQMDRRTDLYKVLDTSYQKVLSDKGGIDGLSHVEVSLIERFIFIEHMLRNLEQRIAMCSLPKKASGLMKKWNGLIKSYTSLARLLGLERKAKPVVSLQSYVISEGKKKKKKKVG